MSNLTVEDRELLCLEIIKRLPHHPKGIIEGVECDLLELKATSEGVLVKAQTKEGTITEVYLSEVKLLLYDYFSVSNEVKETLYPLIEEEDGVGAVEWFFKNQVDDNELIKKGLAVKREIK